MTNSSARSSNDLGHSATSDQPFANWESKHTFHCLKCDTQWYDRTNLCWNCNEEGIKGKRTYGPSV